MPGKPDAMSPELAVTVHSANPILWVSAVRHALRRNGADNGLIDRFTESALAAGEPEGIKSVVSSWAKVDLDLSNGTTS